MIHINNEKDCCGCGACLEVCPKHCIEMREGTLGCVIPYVKTYDCIECGACERVCPIIVSPLQKNYKQISFAAFANDKVIRESGSSGGMFQSFAIKVFSSGGMVYGAAFDDSLRLVCASAKNPLELKPLLKSKYLQSNMTGKFSEIKHNLNNNQLIMFISTPCQVAALKSYLNKEYDNLITVDFFCHGVPSQHFFDECIEYDAKKKYKGRIINYTFREKKKNGATPHYFSCDYETKRGVKHKFSYYFDSTFYAAFQKYICLRESCYSCKFYGKERSSDITIGDFHEIDKYVKGINRFDGISMVVINSTKGQKLFDLCKSDLSVFPVDIDMLIRDHVCFSACTEKPKQRDIFVEEYNQHGIKGLYKRFLNPRIYLKNRIYYSCPLFIRKLIKR